MFLYGMKTVKDVFETFKQQLNINYDALELEAITLLTLSEVTGRSNAQLKAFPESEIAEDQSKAISIILEKLKTGMPVQYAIGYTEFFGLRFKVTPAVLIPRPETEELVAWILAEVKTENVQPVRFLDVGTGSGCIAISLKKYLPSVQAWALDISKDALNMASENALTNNIDVNFIEADILDDQLEHKFTIDNYSIIVSNPPYVTEADQQYMHSRVIGFEPHTALFVNDQHPLIFYKAIADFANLKLTGGGLLFFEINESYGEQVVNLLRHKGFINVELRQDMYGKDRMVRAKKQ